MKVILRKEIMRERDLIQLGHALGSVILFGAIALSGRFSRRRDNKLLIEELERAKRRYLYLASIIDKNEIEIDEFDKIALTEM
jgi:hypothetical protein